MKERKKLRLGLKVEVSLYLAPGGAFKIMTIDDSPRRDAQIIFSLTAIIQPVVLRSRTTPLSHHFDTKGTLQQIVSSRPGIEIHRSETTANDFP
jgi:hypothetical protein